MFYLLESSPKILTSNWVKKLRSELGLPVLVPQNLNQLLTIVRRQQTCLIVNSFITIVNSPQSVSYTEGGVQSEIKLSAGDTQHYYSRALQDIKKTGYKAAVVMPTLSYLEARRVVNLTDRAFKELLYQTHLLEVFLQGNLIENPILGVKGTYINYNKLSWDSSQPKNLQKIKRWSNYG